MKMSADDTRTDQTLRELATAMRRWRAFAPWACITLVLLAMVLL